MLQLFCWLLYKSEAGFSTVVFLGYGTSKFHVGISGISFGEHPLVSQAVQTVATMAQIPVTFDMMPVLTYAQLLHTNGISLHLLSSIALFLTVHSSISRVSCMAWLGSPLLEQRLSVSLYFCLLRGAEQGLGIYEATSRFWIFLGI